MYWIFTSYFITFLSFKWKTFTSFNFLGSLFNSSWFFHDFLNYSFMLTSSKKRKSLLTYLDGNLSLLHFVYLLLSIGIIITFPGLLFLFLYHFIIIIVILTQVLNLSSLFFRLLLLLNLLSLSFRRDTKERES